MKFFSSFVKELKIASRGFYFYIEIFMAVLILAIFIFAVPENFNTKSAEYLYLDMPEEVRISYLEAINDETLDGNAEAVTVEIDDNEKNATLYTTEDKEIYILESQKDTIYMAEEEQKVAAVIGLDDENQPSYTYYLQGYESDKYKNLLKILNIESTDNLQSDVLNQEVKSLSTNTERLSDRENMLPSVLVFNGALMGLFIIAVYIVFG